MRQKKTFKARKKKEKKKKNPEMRLCIISLATYLKGFKRWMETLYLVLYLVILLIFYLAITTM